MNILFIFIMSLFAFVFISDYKTWIGSIFEPIRIKKARRQYEKKTKNSI